MAMVQNPLAARAAPAPGATESSGQGTAGNRPMPGAVKQGLF